MAAGPVDVHKILHAGLEGIAGIWAAALHDADEAVAEPAASLLLRLYTNMEEVEVRVVEPDVPLEEDEEVGLAYRRGYAVRAKSLTLTLTLTLIG